MSSYAILAIIGLLAIFSKNRLLLYASLTLIILKLIPSNKNILELIKNKGSNFGIYMLTLAILVPIAMDKIGMNEFINTVKSTEGIAAIIVGAIVSVFATKGIYLQIQEPELVVALTGGIILGIVFFKGAASGPIIASGITYYVIQLIGKR
ncbi:DUF441 domain-containing protein [Caviibacter abscessus]|uniref:DUF441 domain-containing protein n=1 Tax=Caviibacter abscessus TaxID=1766719 RepID=UPI0008395589|nr:DUF441 domain-containing protein [Caviibacter abscessus]